MTTKESNSESDSIEQLEQSPIKFAIDDVDDIKKLNSWLEEQIQKSLKIQRKKQLGKPDRFLFGSIGGIFSYIFTPTTIGILCTVDCGITGDKLDLCGGI